MEKTNYTFGVEQTGSIKWKYQDLETKDELIIEEFTDGSLLFSIVGEDVQLEPHQLISLGRKFIEAGTKSIENRK